MVANIMQVITQGLAFGGFLTGALLCAALLYYRVPIGYVLPVALWILHGLIFYTVVLANGGSVPGTYTSWSAVLRLHGVMTIVIILAIELLEARRK